MKKFLLTLILAFELTISVAIPVHAAVGIPEYFIPKNTPLREFNKDLLENSKTEGSEIGSVAVNRFLQFVANGLLYIAAPLAILFVAHGGQNYAFAFGEEGKLSAAKRQIMWALIGLVLILSSYLIIQLVLQTVVSIPGSPTQTEQKLKDIEQSDGPSQNNPAQNAA